MTTPPHDLTAERAAIALLEQMGLYGHPAASQFIGDILAALQTTRQEALREAAKVAETITLQAVKAELRWREKHAVEEVAGVAKSKRAECHLRSLGLHIKGELDRLASEGG